MHIEQIDRLCDVFEQRLKQGELLTAAQFLQEQRLPAEGQLLAELQKVEREYREPGVGATVPYRERSPTDANHERDSVPDRALGTLVGPYKLLQKLGEGGMGVVYMADQTRPVARRVALKIIKPGMDSRQVIARFEAERQALALMDHPNIARVLDAGTTDDGRLYFAMELVKGIPITRYCDEKRLTPRERLELFVPICQAVQHAHHKGVIHRDLKPNNVLVAELDDRPVAKIIDFGLAKAISQRLTEQTVFTQYGQIVGTIHYMSPEQASFNQLDVDTRTDVYSLGVLLYELLTGETPFDKQRLHQAAFDELLRIIRQEEPPRPSTRLSSDASLPTIAANRRTEPKKLRLLVRGELDWIVMKALEKERSRRYETANGLAMDLQRYLSDEPVAACPPSATYRLRKLVRRHKRVVTTAAILTVALVLGLVGTTWQWVRASIAEHDLKEALVRATNNEKDAQTNLNRALAAEKEAIERLYRSLVAQARANRYSGRTGQRYQSLEILAEATRLARQLSLPEEGFFQLRNEVISCLTLPDVRVARDWNGCPHGTINMAFDPTFKRYARIDREGLVSVRRVVDDTELWSFEGLGPKFEAWPTWSPDGRYLLVCETARGGRYRLWDLAGVNPDLLLDESGAHAFRSDGREFATAGADGNLQLIELPSGKETRQPTTIPPPQLMFYHPQAPQLAIVSNREVAVLNLDTGEFIARLLRNVRTDWLAWRPDGRVLASGSNKVITLWDAETWQPIRQLIGHTDNGLGFAFSPSGRRLVSHDWSNSLRWWDPYTGEQLLQERVRTTWPQLAPDGRTLAEHNAGDGSLQILEFAAEEAYYRTIKCDPRHGTGVFSSMALSRDNRLLVANVDTGIGLWDFDTGESLAVIPAANCRGVAFDASGSIVAAVAGQVIRLNVVMDESNPSALSISSMQQLIPNVRSEQLQTSRDRKLFALATGDGALIWRADHPDAAIRCGPHFDARHVAISPDDRWVATGSHWGNRVKIWSTEDGTAVQELPVLGGSTVHLSPDGRWLLTTYDGCRLWRTDTWQEIHNLGGESARCAFSPGSSLVAIENGNGVIRLVDPETGRDLACLEDPHQDRAHNIVFDSDGSHLVAGNRDGSIHVWNLRAIRAALAEMTLDWALPGYPPATDWSRVEPIQLTVARFPSQLRPELQLDNEIALVQEQLRRGEPSEAANHVASVLRRVPPLHSSRWDSRRMQFCRWVARDDRLFADVQELCPDVADLWIGRGQHLALLARWSEAADCYSRVIETRPISDDTFEYACLKIMTDGPDESRRYCSQLLRRSAQPQNPFIAYVLARTCAYSPQSAADSAQIVSWAEEALASARAPWYLHAAGAAHFRAGQHDIAVQRLEESNVQAKAGAWSPHGAAQNWLVLAMIEHRAGNAAAAEQWLKQAVDEIEKAIPESAGEPPKMPPADWLGLHVLRREAEAMILGRPAPPDPC